MTYVKLSCHFSLVTGLGSAYLRLSGPEQALGSDQGGVSTQQQLKQHHHVPTHHQREVRYLGTSYLGHLSTLLL
jgi:hypothetical protein